jgi:hypothetical protein
MPDWTIRVAQSPIGFGTPYKHNIIVVVDPAGRAVDEINGGPLDANGRIIPFNDRRGPLAYLSGDFPAGAEKVGAVDRRSDAGLGAGVAARSSGAGWRGRRHDAGTRGRTCNAGSAQRQRVCSGMAVPVKRVGRPGFGRRAVS